MSSKPFAGIPQGRVEVTPLPNVIFSELLPEIDDVAELKVTLHIYYLLYHKKGSPRFVTRDELRADTTLRLALAKSGPEVDETLTRTLQKAEARGTLLHLVTEDEDDLYFFNTAESRRAVEMLERGELELDKKVRRAEPVAVEVTNIFKLYEQNIGAMTPLIIEELKEAELEYPPDVIEDAFRIANENNVRKWSYVRAILEDWTRKGKHETTGRDSQQQRKPVIQGKFADVKRRDR